MALFGGLLLLALPSFAGIDVFLEGNRAFSNRVLRALPPPVPERLREADVRYWAAEAAYDIELHYLEHGYFSVNVDVRVAPPDETDDDWRVTLAINEGRRYRYGPVRVVADGDTLDAPPGTRTLRAREGRRYHADDVARDLREVTRAYGNAGFVRAETRDDLRVDDSLARVHVHYVVERGLAVVFDTLQLSVRRTAPHDSLEGLTRRTLLRSFVPYQRGDTVRARINDDIIAKLRSTGQYFTVRLRDSLPDGAERSILTLDVEERVPGRMGLSAFYETQFGFGVSGDVAHSNVAGSLKEGRLGAGLAQKKQHVSAGYGSPLTFGYLLRFDNDLIAEWYQDKLPDEAIYGGDFRAANISNLSRSFSYWLRWVGGTELEYKNRVVADTAGDLSRERGGLFNVINTGFISFLDHPLNPAQGMRYALTWGNGGAVYERGEFGLAERHNWLEAKSAWYGHPPEWSQFKLALRLDGGRFFGEGGQNADRFFLGGPRNVRSYGFRQLCPDIPSPEVGSCPLLGTPLEPAYFLASAELRISPLDFPGVSPHGFIGFFKPVELVPFVDFGKVWNLRGEESFELSREFFTSGHGRGVAWGGGFRYPLLGVFNLRVDLAWGREGGGSLPDRWLVDLAQAF